MIVWLLALAEPGLERNLQQAAAVAPPAPGSRCRALVDDALPVTAWGRLRLVDESGPAAAAPARADTKPWDIAAGDGLRPKAQAAFDAAIGGGAFTASRYVITNLNQIKPSVRARLWGTRDLRAYKDLRAHKDLRGIRVRRGHRGLREPTERTAPTARTV